MKRSIFSAIVLAAATGEFAAVGGNPATGDEQSPLSLKPVVDMDTLGAKDAPASMVKRRPPRGGAGKASGS